ETDDSLLSAHDSFIADNLPICGKLAVSAKIPFGTIVQPPHGRSKSWACKPLDRVCRVLGGSFFGRKNPRTARVICMSFQAYLDNIKAKTGKTPEDFRNLAKKKGLLQPDLKASELVAWLKEEFDLGHGHSMALWAVFKDNGWVTPPKKKS